MNHIVTSIGNSSTGFESSRGVEKNIYNSGLRKGVRKSVVGDNTGGNDSGETK